MSGSSLQCTRAFSVPAHTRCGGRVIHKNNMLVQANSDTTSLYKLGVRVIRSTYDKHTYQSQMHMSRFMCIYCMYANTWTGNCEKVEAVCSLSDVKSSPSSLQTYSLNLNQANFSDFQLNFTEFQ